MAGVIRVGVIDDDAMLREGMQAWFHGATGAALVASAGGIDEFDGLGCEVDVVLLDLNLRDHSEPSANVRRLVASGRVVLIVSTIPDAEHVAATIAAGARGYVTKDRDLATLVAAIEEVAAGGFALSPELALILSRDHGPSRPTLSPKERAILRDYAGGMKLDAVARKNGMKPGTARTHLSRVKAKYAAAGRAAYTKIELGRRLREDRLELDGLPPRQGGDAPEATW